MKPINRRRMLIVAAAAPVIAVPMTAGCDSETVKETIEATDTKTLEQGRIALRGFAIVSYLVGTRVVALPTPGVRILGVVLIVTSITTKLAIEYLDVELKKRYVAEDLDESEVRQLESQLAVVFQLESGDTEKVPLGPNRYDQDAKEA